jgi:hypothetical protein
LYISFCTTTGLQTSHGISLLHRFFFYKGSNRTYSAVNQGTPPENREFFNPMKFIPFVAKPVKSANRHKVSPSVHAKTRSDLSIPFDTSYSRTSRCTSFPALFYPPNCELAIEPWLSMVPHIGTRVSEVEYRRYPSGSLFTRVPLIVTDP